MVEKEKRRGGLADALFTRTQQRVLSVLFGDTTRSYFATEIIRRAHVGSGTVQRELIRLAEGELVVVTQIGNQKHYQANAAAPIFDELRSIVLKTMGLVEPLRAALGTMPIDLALIYGSVGRGTDRATSDVDLLVVADDVTLETVYARLAPVEQTLGRPISPTLLTRDEFRRRRKNGNPFLAKILAGDHLLLTGSLDAIAAAR